MATTAIKPRQRAAKTKGLRNVMAFPRIKEFYEVLVDRMHMSLNRFFLDHEFTFYLNALPRDHEVGTLIQVPRFKEVKLIYGGIQKLRELLEKTEKEQRILDLDEAWDYLENDFRRDTKDMAVSAGIYEKFASGKFGIEDVAAGTMQAYFQEMLNEGDLEHYENQGQIRENKILKHFNLINDYCYLSVPLIQFGEFDGVVHIILHEEDLRFFGNLKWDEKAQKEVLEVTNLKQIGNLIKQFSIEYEGLILDWDIVEGEKWKEKSLRSLIDNAVDPELYNRLNKNKILEQLRYQQYYLRHKNYFLKRFEYSSEMPLVVRKQYRRTAIMSILIDSFAHNISAHSLTALEWHFKQRAELLKKLEDPKADHAAELKKLENLPLLANNRHLDNEIHPFLRFMLDKGAFWTGLTRESNFGGKISSLFSVLWFNFVNNPLYLGTIAFSEGIKMIKIRVTVLKPGDPKANIFYRKTVLLDGEFATIDLSHVYEDGQRDEDTVSNYVTKGKDFNEIKKAMQKFRAFFPGGVVGQHAFFTILENEIRNVKHFGEQAIDEMKENGLTLNLSLEEDTYQDDNNNTKYYKIGVWIKHKVKITEKLLKVRLEKLWGDIITEKTYRPLLGGIFQDKVCASMLFNNEFSSVQEQYTNRSKRFYPYIKVGCSQEENVQKDDVIREYEISARRFYKDGKKEEAIAFFQEHFQPFDGYYKKFFHLWKGEEIYKAEDMEKVDNEWENIARFSFVYLPKKSPLSHFQKLREKGIIRIIDRPTNQLFEAYRRWLSSWLKDTYPDLITFSVKGQLASILVYQDGIAQYFPQGKIPQLSKPGHAIKLVHGSGEKDAEPGVVRIRQHGIFRRYFCEGVNPEDAIMSPEKAIEFFEILNTNICIFDNRIANRIATSGTDVYEKKLNCLILEEKKAFWKAEQTKGFDRFHFLVVHLSFIESFQNPQGEKYQEDNIQEFIDEEVTKNWKVKENFILVVTTGRGRTQWWENLQPIHRTLLGELDPAEEQKNRSNSPLPHSSFVTFRPVESLIAAVENSLQMKDDLELKYRLVKVLFGS